MFAFSMEIPFAVLCFGSDMKGFRLQCLIRDSPSVPPAWLFALLAALSLGAGVCLNITHSVYRKFPTDNQCSQPSSDGCWQQNDCNAERLQSCSHSQEIWCGNDVHLSLTMTGQQSWNVPLTLSTAGADSWRWEGKCASPSSQHQVQWRRR